MRLSIFYSFIFSFLAFAGKAQQIHNFRQLSVGQGLPGENVRSLFQDKYGILWFGIESEGLCKYNGSYFENLSYNEKDSLIISSNYINDIAGDLNGNLWLATEKGLNILDRRLNKFYSYSTPLLPHNVCLTVSSDSSGIIWVGTSNGLVKFVPHHGSPKDEKQQIIGNKNNKITYTAEEDALTRRLQGIAVKRIYQENKNSYWIGTDDGMFYYEKNQQKILHWYKNQEPNSLSNSEVSDIVPLSNNFFLVGTDNGVNLFDRNTNSFSRIAFQNSNIFNDAKVGIVDIHKDKKGVIWIGTSSYGIIKGNPYLENGNPLPYPIKTPQMVQGISSKHIMDIFEDNSGQLWVSTKFGGTYIFDKRSQTFPLFTLPASQEEGNIENQNFVISSEEDTAGNIWIGTRDRGIFKYWGSTHQFQEFPVYNGEFLIRRIECLLYSQNGNIWFGHKWGAGRLNPATKQQQLFQLPKVQAIFEDATQNIWMGTTEGLFIYDIGQDSIRQHPSNHPLLFKNADISIEVIHQDQNGSMWVGTDNHGLFRYFPQEDSLVQYIHNPKDPNSISGNIIRSITQDSKGKIWVGTKSSGLNLFEEGKGFIHFKKNDGLPSNTIFSINEDKDGNLWITTNNGISKFNHANKNFTNFSRSHGLQGNVFERRASLKLENGKIFIAGNNGFNLFDPAAIQLENFDPPMVVNAVKANGKVLEKDIISAKNISLAYHQNQLSLEFSSLDFRDPSSIKYAYQLEGLDQEWVYSGNSNNVTYSNLAHGDYTFRFKATDANGNWSEARQAINLNIQRPPWLSWWAYLFYTAFAGFLVFLLYYIATVRANYFHQLKSKEIELKQEKELHQMKLNFFTNISHELRTPLTLIVAPLEKMFKSVTQSNEMYSSIRAAYSSSRQLLHLADQLIYFRKAEQANFRLRLSQQDIVTFTRDLVLPFQELAEKEKICFEFYSFCPELMLWFDQDKVEKIVNNLLINAFKFTPPGGKIVLSIASIVTEPELNKQTSFLKMEVSDTGKGMTEPELNYIFKRYYQSDPVNIGAGIGLELVKKLLELHKGEIKVKSKPGEGSVFSILLPAEKAIYSQQDLAEARKDYLNSKPIPVDVFLKESLQEPAIAEKPALTGKELRQSLLIVEDNIELVRFLQENLCEEFNITVAKNGKEALSKLEGYYPDIILSDIMMKEMNGLEFCSAIKENLATSHIPLVLLTARTLEEQQVEGYELGAEGYLLKPFDLDVLKAKLKSLVKNRQQLIKKIQSEFVFEPKHIATNNTDEQFLKKLLDIISSNFQNPDFHVEELASDLHLSRSQLFRKLKALTGQTPSEYLYAFRISQAINHLKEGELTIAEISYQTGFKSPNSFTKTFTKHLGTSPKKYRGEIIS